MSNLNPVNLDNSQIGYESLDDAALYPLPDGRIIVQSVDFFTPIVDDPFTFGQIAATNSLSDIYAMGAKPLFALNIVGFPKEDLPLSVLTDILNGGLSVTEKVGIPILGGHTVKDKEPKYGLVVTGEAYQNTITRNNTAKPGDVLILTKPLGTGIITTAIKREIADFQIIRAVTDTMKSLNNTAADAMTEIGVSACTDVTGFGLLGHLLEMCEGSNVSAVIEFDQVDFLEGVFELAQKGVVPGGSKTNLKHVEPHTSFSGNFPLFKKLMLADAQTSGGLLISVPESKSADLIAEVASSVWVLQTSINSPYLLLRMLRTSSFISIAVTFAPTLIALCIELFPTSPHPTTVTLALLLSEIDDNKIPLPPEEYSKNCIPF